MLSEHFSKSRLIGGVLALSSSVAFAEPALLETNAKLRSGPGMQFATQTVLPGGATVDVLDCGGRWCAVAYGQRQGYVARSLIDFEETVVVQPPAQIYASTYATYPAHGAYIVGPIYADYYSLTAYGPYGAWPAPSYPYYRDYYFRPGLSFGVGLGF
jgi:uncharacterized protein YraI